jgi:mRNA interferase RelE/StbE
MRYNLSYKPEAQRDLAKLSPDVARRVIRKLEAMCNDLAGDVKRLVDYKPGWRLRVGDWRVLSRSPGQPSWCTMSFIAQRPMSKRAE